MATYAPTFNDDFGAPLARAVYALVNGKMQADNDERQAQREMRLFDAKTQRESEDRALSRALQAVGLAKDTGIITDIPGMDQAYRPAMEGAAKRTQYQQQRDRERDDLASIVQRMGAIERGDIESNPENPGEEARAALGSEKRAAALDADRARADYYRGARSGTGAPKFNEARGEARQRALMAAGLADEKDLSTELVNVGTDANGNPIFRARPLDKHESARRIKSVQDAYARELARLGFGLDGKALPSDRLPQATESGAISGGTRGFDDNGNPTDAIPAGPDFSAMIAAPAAPAAAPAPAPAAPARSGFLASLVDALGITDEKAARMQKTMSETPGFGGRLSVHQASADQATKPAPVTRGSKGGRSLSAALALPINKGRSPDAVKADLERLGYLVTP